MPDHEQTIGNLMLRVLDYLSHERSLTLAVLSPDLVVVEATEKFDRFQGDPSSKPIGRPVTDLIWELVGSEEGLKDVLEGKEGIFSLENVNRDNGNGESIYLSIRALPLSKENPAEGLLLILEDTTFTSTLEQQLVQERNELRLTKSSLARANDELQRLNQLKSLFLSIAAHDLRSPLTAMRGYTALALKALPADALPEISEYLSIVQSLVDTQSRLISDFLDVDVIEQGRLKIRPVFFDPNPVILEVAEVMRSIAGRKQVRITTGLDQDLQEMYADPDRLKQILFNLIGNAIKYTNDGDRVEVGTERAGDHAVISVSDHGPGVPASEVPRLFDLYHRTEDARQSRVKGLGLGLFIVKSIVDLHGGRITVDSEPGKGTTFRISIPLHETQPEEQNGRN